MNVRAKLGKLSLIVAAFIVPVSCSTSPDHSAPLSGKSSSSPSIARPQVELPFTGLDSPTDLAVDSAGDVYVTDEAHNRVLKLPAGSNTQVELPFTGLTYLGGLAVDTAGNVYVTDGPVPPGAPGQPNAGRVLKLPTGSNAPVALPFTDLNNPGGVAVDSSGNVYVSDWGFVSKLAAGSNTATKLPFNGVKLAADAAGNLYLTDVAPARVLKLPPGTDTPAELPFTGLKVAGGVTVDAAGNVYFSDFGNNRVLKLPAGSNTQVELPFTGLNSPAGVAVDTAGNVYVADDHNNRVVKLPAG
jgi:serine/threonine-protein kinase